MPDLIVTYSKVMRAEIDRLNLIAQNVANVNSVGYLARTSAIDGSGFLELIAGSSGNSLATSTSREASALAETGINTNIAVVDDAWFVIKKDTGELHITRSGSFHVNQEGVLRFGNDYTVMGESGEITNVTPEMTVMANGDVLGERGFVDQLRLVKTANAAKIGAVGDGAYRVNMADGHINNVEEGGKQVLQGALNTSNVKVGDEMVRLTEITRHIESVQRAMSAYDDMLKSAINELGK